MHTLAAASAPRGRAAGMTELQAGDREGVGASGCGMGVREALNQSESRQRRAQDRAPLQRRAATIPIRRSRAEAAERGRGDAEGQTPWADFVGVGDTSQIPNLHEIQTSSNDPHLP